ncbi:squamosa promoter-binding-like protein 7 [Tasmannia lanceolata]|uniref:squamosa promoter-binding-like protein 7 n=1 Tax=Tasmannia lanceolata TaxID=3420 RepID=UPI0040631BFD
MENGGGRSENCGGKIHHNLPWDYWEVGNWGAITNNNPPPSSFNESATQLTVCLPAGNTDHHYRPYTGGGLRTHVTSDPHLTCLKLGKRHYFEDGRLVGDGHVAGLKRRTAGSTSASVPRCQVEGCHVALLNVKEYHRRHKVCEMHSKAPKVVVLGMEQRFCQQCSRFHLVSEFDDSKRSCRRRLAGHNERRRKSTNESMTRNLSQETKLMGGRFPCISSTGRALSLLSSMTSSWVSPTDLDLSSRSSAALRELIAENRAAVLARQLFSDRVWHHGLDETGGGQMFLSHVPHQQHQVVPDGSERPCLVPEWSPFHGPAVHLTLDLMQTPNSSFGIMSGRSKSKEDEECCEIWKSLEGTHVA